MKNVFAILAPAVLPYHSPFWWTVDYMVLPIALGCIPFLMGLERKKRAEGMVLWVSCIASWLVGLRMYAIVLTGSVLFMLICGRTIVKKSVPIRIVVGVIICISLIPIGSLVRDIVESSLCY